MEEHAKISAEGIASMLEKPLQHRSQRKRHAQMIIKLALMIFNW